MLNNGLIGSIDNCMNCVLQLFSESSEEGKHDGLSAMDTIITKSSQSHSYEMAILYLNNRARFKNSETKGILLLQALAGKYGHANSQYDLAVYCDKNKRTEEAEKWWGRAVANDYAPALFKRGIKLLEQGDVNGQRLIDKAAVSGQLSANQYYKLAEIYSGGKYDQPVNSRRAYTLYTKAAEKGLLKAQLFLGNYYCDKGLSAQNISRAIKWYKEAAAQGSEDARLNLKHIKESKEYKFVRMKIKLNSVWTSEFMRGLGELSKAFACFFGVIAMWITLAILLIGFLIWIF